MDQPCVHFRDRALEDPRHANQLAFHVARRRLSGEHEAGAHLQAESACELHADISVQPVIGLQVPAVHDLLVEIGENALAVGINALDANRKRGRSRACQPVYGETRRMSDDPVAGHRLHSVESTRVGFDTNPMLELSGLQVVRRLDRHMAGSHPHGGRNPLLVCPFGEAAREDQKRESDHHGCRGERAAPSVPAHATQGEFEQHSKSHRSASASAGGTRVAFQAG